MSLDSVFEKIENLQKGIGKEGFTIDIYTGRGMGRDWGKDENNPANEVSIRNVIIELRTSNMASGKTIPDNIKKSLSFTTP